MAYDDRRGVTVLFGGAIAGARAADTWEWDGSTWELVATTGPSGRESHAMAFDAVRGVTVLHGGGLTSQTWEWDGAKWDYKGNFNSTIRILSGHCMAFDSWAGQVVAVDTNQAYSTWAWDGISWRFLVRPLPFGMPGPIPSFAFDRGRNVFVLVSGVTRNYIALTGELPSCPIDSDGDGLFDPYDACDQSDRSEMIVLDTCNTGLTNQLFPDGCTMMDRIVACEGAARNHGAYVACVGDLVHAWADEGVIDETEKGDIVRCAAQADAPLRNIKKLPRANLNHPNPEPTEQTPRP